LRHGGRDDLHLLQHLQAALDLTGAIFPRPVSVDEPLDLADLFLLVVIGGPLALDLFLLLVQVALEVPGIGSDLAVLHLERR